jgi:23S rRNA (cytosine1962-C5)-methyltransferase
MIKGSVILSPGKQASIERFHPWVFSGAIREIKGDVKEGDIVEVLDAKKKFLGLGHYQKSGIAVRLFSFENVDPDKDFWRNKLLAAIALRKDLGLIGHEHTNTSRLVFGEGDGLPGLIIDYYDGAAVLQSHSRGMYLLRDTFKEALLSIKELNIDTLYDKSAETLPAIAGEETENDFLHGDKHETMVSERVWQ